VTTITGTGHQGEDKEGGKSGIEQEISSPWDVEIAAAPGINYIHIYYKKPVKGPENTESSFFLTLFFFFLHYTIIPIMENFPIHL